MYREQTPQHLETLDDGNLSDVDVQHEEPHLLLPNHRASLNITLTLLYSNGTPLDFTMTLLDFTGSSLDSMGFHETSWEFTWASLD